MNLAEAMFGPEPLSIRRIANLVWGLPDDSVFRAAITVAPTPEPPPPPQGVPTIGRAGMRALLGEG